MRQTVRLDEVRAPRAPQDDLTPDAVLGVDGSAVTLDDHYKGVLTQIRSLLGAATWREQPLASVTSLASFQRDAVATLRSQAQAQVQQSEQLQSQAQSIQVLTAAALDVAGIRAQVAQLQMTVATFSGADASASASLAQQLNQIDGALSQSLSTLSLQVSSLSNQMADDAARIASLESQAQSFVTRTALSQAITGAYAVDQIMLGVRDALNLVFVAPTPFVPQTLRIALNGQILRQGADGDYTVLPSAAGVLFDTIELVHPDGAPYAQDLLTATYIPATTP